MKKKQDKTEEKQFHIQLAVSLSAILLLLLIFTLVLKKQEYSEKEGRELSRFPIISADRMLEGTAQSDTEHYLSDHFAFRDFFTGLAQFTEQLTGVSERNGIYKGKSGYLLKKFTGLSEEERKKKTSAIATFAENYPSVKTYMLLVPTAENIISDKLPSGAPNGDQDAFIQAVGEDLAGKATLIDVSKTLRNHKEELLYYKSDSKWTSLGAYYAYREAGQVMGVDMTLDNFEALPVTESFVGDLAKKSGFAAGTDTINCYFPQDSSYTIVVEDVYAGTKSASPYSSEALLGHNKYDVFYGGDKGLLRINSTALKKDRLLVIKDSYANCFIPLLSANYCEIIVIDPRYFYGNLEEVMADENIKDVLFLYGADTLAEDTALVPVLEGK